MMKRRDVVGILGGAVLAGAALVAGAAPEGPSAWRSVDTPEKRESYTRGLLKELCTDIGPKPAGSEAYDRAAAIIEREMRRSLPQVRQVELDMEGWKLTGAPLLKVGDTEVEIWPYSHTPGTPAEGVTGVLRKSGGGFTLVDQKTGERRAIFGVSPFGRAIPHPDARWSSPAFTLVGVGKQDVPFLERAAEAGTPATLRVPVRFTGLVTTSSVMGTLPGRSKEEILFVSHLDTLYNSPGANDNTASTIVMVMLAHAAAAMRPERTLTFIATGAEEHYCIGARKCAQLRERAGTMGNIRYVVNFDSLTYGPNLQIYSTDADMRDLIRSIHADLKINATPRYFEESGFTMDSAAFRASGAKAIYANSRGYDERTLPVYHRPEDTADSVPLDCVEISFRVFEEFIRRVGWR
ncbi:MAG: M28 family peptidase [Armatimonadetes bacterium]|nr:M28 family peptidase [Armatimonadota bacterium]